MAYAYLPLSVIDQHVPRMRQLGVSEVARAPGGFLPAYRRAGGDPNKLSAEWDRKREAFIKRHYAQVKRRGEPLWKDGAPTRRHLALIAWAYSPDAARRRNPDVPSALHGEIAGAIDRAVSAGANRGTLEYLGAGAEGILFLDGDTVYKVGRGRSLRHEADALEELDRQGLPVPRFKYYNKEHDVIVREHVVGRPGTWGTRGLREIYDEKIRPALRKAGFSCGEYKEDSFIVEEDTGAPIMVDLGFLCPVGQRAVRELERRMARLSPDDSWFELQSDIRFALSDGDITATRASLWADRIASVFGEDKVRDLRSLIRSYREMHMRENPPWADKALRQEWDRIAEADLPMPLRGARGKFEELGCGHYGCVMPTNDDRVVFKLTSDPTEAEFIKLAQPLGWPDGIVRYYGVQEIDFQYKRRQVFAVWREAAHNVGNLSPSVFSRAGDDYETRSRTEFVRYLQRFKDHAARIRDQLVRAKDPGELWTKAKNLEDWAWNNISSDDAEGRFVQYRFTYPRIEAQRGAYRLAASWRACAIIADLMENTYLSDSVGGAFTFYMEHKMLLADVHAGNVGQVEREDYGDPIWVITDPGHVVVLS